MGRQLRRVPLDFDWPVGRIWPAPPTCEYGYPELCGAPADFLVTEYEPETRVCRAHLNPCAPRSPWGMRALNSLAERALALWRVPVPDRDDEWRTRAVCSLRERPLIAAGSTESASTSTLMGALTRRTT